MVLNYHFCNNQGFAHISSIKIGTPEQATSYEIITLFEWSNIRHLYVLLQHGSCIDETFDTLRSRFNCLSLNIKIEVFVTV